MDQWVEDGNEKVEGGAYGVDGCSGVTVHTVEPAGEGEGLVTGVGEEDTAGCYELEDICSAPNRATRNESLQKRPRSQTAR